MKTTYIKIPATKALAHRLGKQCAKEFLLECDAQISAVIYRATQSDRRPRMGAVHAKLGFRDTEFLKTKIKTRRKS